LSTEKWYLRAAADADPKHGRRAVDMILVRLRAILAHT
jgi:hypothetical protein